LFRVIFDRSIFHHGKDIDKFSLLKNSSLSSHVSSGKIRLLYTPLFLCETLNHFRKNKYDFEKQWAFLVRLNRSKWFHSSIDIMSSELGNNMVGRKYYFCSRSEINNMLQNTTILLQEGIKNSGFFPSEDEINYDNKMKEYIRGMRLSLRETNPKRDYIIDDSFEEGAIFYIENGLMKRCSDSDNYLNVWRSNWSKCRFTKQYIRSWLTTVLLPISDHNLRIDRNDQADAEQLSYMEWGDIFVSDDMKFMKTAFDILFGNTTKIFMSSTEFLDFLNQL
jgi:hypothetical protein